MRQSGVLLPIFSLPGKYGIGAFSKEAYEFVDFLEKAGQSYWQILPLGPTSYGDSPYQSFSTFAGNPYFISLETLIEEGLLTEAECEAADFGESENYIDYYLLFKNRFTLLRKAFDWAELKKDKAYAKFIAENDYWLEDYAFYMSVKKQFKDEGLDKWDDDIRLREEGAVLKYKKALAEDIAFYKFLQYKFLQQWTKLKKYANDRNIKLIGDIPIYVSYDSADTWANPELFDFDEDRRPISVAGCPPDAFCADGQLWGNPIYRWDYHKKTDYKWWKLRMQKCVELYDVIRIDHFRGFDEFYSIPAGAETARTGEWKKGPGLDLFNALKSVLKDSNIIAEDLGFITDSVRQLVAETGFPNMKVIEFAFDVNDKRNKNDYLPHNYNQNAVVYTGTHDNETLLGWLQGISTEDLEKVKSYLNYKGDDYEEMVDLLVRLAHSSVADMCIIPLQDYLRLDNSARINRPATLGNNWGFRVSKASLTDEVAERINSLTVQFGRGGRIEENNENNGQQQVLKRCNSKEVKEKMKGDNMKNVFERWCDMSLILRILIGLVIGATLGVLCPGIGWIGVLGSVFVGALKGIAPILVAVLVASALAKSGEGIGARFRTVIILYMLSTLLAAIVAVAGSYLFPVTMVLSDASEGTPPEGLGEVISGIIKNMVSNPLSSVSSANYIGVLFWAVIIGLALKKCASQATIQIVHDAAEAVSITVRWIIQFAPFGILGLVYESVAESGLSIFTTYGKLLALLVGCMLLVALVVDPLIAAIYLKRNPYPLVFKCLKESGLTAFFTRSSAANIPVNMELCEKLGMEKDFYSVSIPLGATINMDGAAVTITVMTLAAAHTLGIIVDIPTALLLSLLATVGACGASGVAGGSLLLIPMACSLFGISNDVAMQVVAVGFIISVIQDSVETALNSSGDVMFAATADFHDKLKKGKSIPDFKNL